MAEQIRPTAMSHGATALNPVNTFAQRCIYGICHGFLSNFGDWRTKHLGASTRIGPKPRFLDLSFLRGIGCFTDFRRRFWFCHTHEALARPATGYGPVGRGIPVRLRRTQAERRLEDGV